MIVKECAVYLLTESFGLNLQYVCEREKEQERENVIYWL